MQRAIDTLSSAGHYIWQGFDGNRGGDPDEVAPGPTASNCAAYMSELCAPAWQNVPMTLQWDNKNTTLAAFLVGRGPVACTSFICAAAFLPASALGQLGATVSFARHSSRSPLLSHAHRRLRRFITASADIGWGWNGGPLPPWASLFDLDVGEPLGLCAAATPGVFSRQWTKGSVSIDCNAFTAELNFGF